MVDRERPRAASPLSRPDQSPHHTFHAIAVLAASRLSEAPDGRLAFAEQDLSEVDRALAEIRAGPELEHAVVSLVHLAAHLEEDRDSRDAARLVLSLAARAARLLSPTEVLS